MNQAERVRRAGGYLDTLCREIPDRRVGSDGNRRATDFFAAALRSFGFTVETPSFDCIDWLGGGADLSVGGSRYDVRPSPYSLGCRTRAPLAVVSSLEDLETVDLTGRVALLRGDLARGQLLPKNFPFYRDEVHARILSGLEAGQPAAVVTAGAPDPSMAGGLYPYPVIEDGDFEIPSVFMTQEEGERLAGKAGETVEVESRATRIPSTACNVVGRSGPREPRIVVAAHIDSKPGSPGANDNASGVVALLLLAERCSASVGSGGIEIVAINGEDYYSNPGEQLYLEENAGRFPEIALAVNLDGPAYVQGRIAYSLYGCPDSVRRLADEVLADRRHFVEGPPWYQGDHSLFIQNGVPALALTSEAGEELAREIIHTPNDKPETVDATKLAILASALLELLKRL
jgi:aminopeptidase YwaD